jgi:glutathione S-transferase
MPSDLGSLSRPSGGVNPAAQGPVLVVDGHAVSDSTTILKTLDELRPGVLVPLDPKRAAEAWIFEELADRSLNGFVVAARWADPLNFSALQDAYFGRAPWFVRTFILPRVREQVLAGLVARDVTREGLAATWSEMRRVLDALEERAPYEGWWMGTDEPTVADLGLFGQLHALRSPLTPAQARELVRRPKLTDWLDRVDERTRATRAGATEVPL